MNIPRADSDIQAHQNQIDLRLRIQKRQTWFHLNNWNISIDFVVKIELFLYYPLFSHTLPLGSSHFGTHWTQTHRTRGGQLDRPKSWWTFENGWQWKYKLTWINFSQTINTYRQHLPKHIDQGTRTDPPSYESKIHEFKSSHRGFQSHSHMILDAIRIVYKGHCTAK